jgi:hypothetical protein
MNDEMTSHHTMQT